MADIYQSTNLRIYFYYLENNKMNENNWLAFFRNQIKIGL